MSAPPTPFDESRPSDALDARLDDLLCASAEDPDAAFTEATLERVRAEGSTQEAGVDARVEFLLEQAPLRPSEDFTARTLARIEAEGRDAATFVTTSTEAAISDTVVGFPKWIVALGSMAAAMAVGMAAFFWLFYGINPAQRNSGNDAIAQQDTPAAVDGTATANWAPEATGTDPLLSAQMTELMVLEEDLFAIAMLLDDTDLQGLDTSILQ
ncbi:MAG: hypothetical protein ACFB20_00750 [Opitutales bacterium]